MLRANLHTVDVDRHVRVYLLLRTGSQELRSMYEQTSIGGSGADRERHVDRRRQRSVQFARELSAHGRTPDQHPPTRWRAAWGEDVKVMGVRIKGEVELTVCALIGAHLDNLDAYLAEKAAIKRLALEEAQTRI